MRKKAKNKKWDKSSELVNKATIKYLERVMLSYFLKIINAEK